MGSNQRHPRYGRPQDVILAALENFSRKGFEVLGVSTIIRSRPIGPSLREYANAAALIRHHSDPLAILETLQSIESSFGRRRRGQRWRARVLDLDIVLWSGGIWADTNLRIPHPQFRDRPFVLGPAIEIARDWKDPISNLSLAQLNARLTRAHRLTR